MEKNVSGKTKGEFHSGMESDAVCYQHLGERQLKE